MEKPNDRILAFRAITRLTGIIQHYPHHPDPSGSFEVETIDFDLNDRRILIFSVAFTILAALEHEVVAVATKTSTVGTQVDDDKNINRPRFVGLLFTSNDRPTDRKKLGPKTDCLSDSDDKKLCPIIIPIARPVNLLENNTPDDLKAYVDSLW